jgi:hypothetical protein
MTNPKFHAGDLVDFVDMNGNVLNERLLVLASQWAPPGSLYTHLLTGEISSKPYGLHVYRLTGFKQQISEECLRPSVDPLKSFNELVDRLKTPQTETATTEVA